MFQKSTMALVAIALILGAGVIVAETQRDPATSTLEGERGANRPVFSFEEGDVTGIHIETDGQVVTFERDAEGRWQMTAPEAMPAEPAAIAFLLSRLTGDGLLHDLTLEGAERSDFGLEVPFATVELTLGDGSSHRLIVGTRDFSGEGIYALIDPEQFPLPQEATDIPLAVLSQDVLNGIDRPLEEWQAVTDPVLGEEAIPSQDDPPVDTPAETLPLPPAPPVE